jgi:hypothetical protein
LKVCLLLFTGVTPTSSFLPGSNFLCVDKKCKRK